MEITGLETPFQELQRGRDSSMLKRLGMSAFMDLLPRLGIESTSAINIKDDGSCSSSSSTSTSTNGK